MRNYLILIAILSIFTLKAQQSKLWNEYERAQKKGTEHKLPNFSFAGYKYSEVPIPDVKEKQFNVLDYGADKTGVKSSKEAIRKAIADAENNKGGIVYFPKGRYLINASGDDVKPIYITKSNIIFRGESNAEDGSVLFFENDLPAEDPNKMWSCPPAIMVKANKGDKLITEVNKDAQRETYALSVNDASKIKKGDWVVLKVQNNASDLIEYDLNPITPDKEWKSILNEGVIVNERHQVKNVKGNNITFFEPIHYDVQTKHNWQIYSFGHVEELGFENLMFQGNWVTTFVHHKNAQHDGGWTILELGRTVNSWVKNCSFKNVSRAVVFSQSAYCTALSNTIEGNYGHSAISAGGGSTGILIARCTDSAGQWHSFGVQGGSTTGTVIWRCVYPDFTCFESHASQPRCTLFDCVEGGFFAGRAGGARQNLPNHGRYLVLWNYKETDKAEEDFRFIAQNSWYWRIVPPIIVGFHGAGTTFKIDEVDAIESLGQRVDPESLWEAQLKLRLGQLPKWLEGVK